MTDCWFCRHDFPPHSHDIPPDPQCPTCGTTLILEPCDCECWWCPTCDPIEPSPEELF